MVHNEIEEKVLNRICRVLNFGDLEIKIFKESQEKSLKLVQIFVLLHKFFVGDYYSMREWIYSYNYGMGLIPIDLILDDSCESKGLNKVIGYLESRVRV